MKLYPTLALAIFALFIIPGCKSRPPVIKNGKQVEICLLVNNNAYQENGNIKSMQYVQVAGYMTQKLVALLKSYGYIPVLLDREKDYKPSPSKYLLKVKLEKYTFRPIGTTLETSYILSNKGELMRKTHHCGTSRGWRNCVERLNLDMVNAISSKIAQ